MCCIIGLTCVIRSSVETFDFKEETEKGEGGIADRKSLRGRKVEGKLDGKREEDE
jgi:hypothetical protein